MSWDFWLMLALHGALFFWTRRRINKRKKELEKENSQLVIENEQHNGTIAYLKRELERMYGS